MFENFVLNEKIFRLEVAVIRKLKNYRDHLEQVLSRYLQMSLETI
jgi:hypothetical protein